MTSDYDLEKVTRFGFVMNILSDLLAAGMLPLAGAFSTSGFHPLAGILLLGLATSLCWYTLRIYGALSEIYRREPKPLHHVLFSGRGAACVDMMLLNLCFFCCVMYVDFAVDLLTPSLSGLLGGFISSNIHPRSVHLALIIWVGVFPLCSLRDLAALAPFSMVGVGSVFFVAAFMVLRSLDGTYAPGGIYWTALVVLGHTDPIEEAAENPKGTSSPLEGFINAGKLFGTLALGFCSHYNAAEYYKSLTLPTPAKFARTSTIAYATVAAVYSIVMISGQQTFGSDCKATILNNYHPSADMGASMGRIAIAISLITSFPLIFSGLRRSALDALGVNVPSGTPKNHDSSSNFPAALEDGGSTSGNSSYTLGKDGEAQKNLATLALLVCVHATSWLMPDVGYVVGILGSTFGAATIFAVPGLLSISHWRSIGAQPIKVALETEALLPMGVLSWALVCGSAVLTFLAFPY